MTKVTKIGWCKFCKSPFIKKGNQRYCNEVCSKNGRLETRRAYEKKRPKRNEYIAELMRKGRANGTIKNRAQNGTSIVVGKPPESKIDPITDEVIEPTDKEWISYHNKVKKMKQETMGGYVDYIDEDYEDY